MGLILVLTAGLLPVAAMPAPVMPGFIVLNQTALVVTYSLGAWMLFAQFWRGRTASLLLAAAGTLFTAVVVSLHLLCMANVLTPGLLLGDGHATLTLLWTAWHLAPPLWGGAVAALLTQARPRAVPAKYRLAAVTGAGMAALLLAGLCLWLATGPAAGRVVGNDYNALLQSGLGPAIEAVTLAALTAMFVATRRRRSTLDAWIIASLALLAMDLLLTLAGGARGSIGWMAGRLVATASASAVIWAYLHEVERLRWRAEAALDELATTEKQLRAAQKMEAVGQLTGGIAHDFNNLLMVVTSGFDVIRRKPHDPVRVVKMAEAGLQAAERGARLTRQLLTFSRRKSLRPEIVNPNTQLMEFERLASRAAGETVQLKFTLDAAVHPVLMDTAEFEAAVLNIIGNARDALMPKGGHVIINSRNVQLDEAMADTTLRPGQYVVVSITDDGPGMTAEVIRQAFEPFFTTKDFGKGSGMGLSQVYGFARAAEGEAVIHSVPGAGATVELWLPRATPARQALDGLNRDQDTPLRRAHAGEVVMAVEDEADVLAAVVENLADLGYHVIAARDGAEALERLRGGERVDVLFSDVVMPGGMNGVQLASEATRLRPRLRVLLTSGYEDQALAGAHELPPHLDILPKPYRQAELANRLQLVMRAA